VRSRGDRIELAIILVLIVATLISFVVFAVDPLGIVVLVLLLVCLGLYLKQR
jgi:high-affinity K+ transport system ATPase subunit B